MRDERKKQGQTNKAKQHSTPKAVTFPRKNELPRVGLEPTTLYTLDRALYQLLSWLGPNLTSHSTPDEQANHQLSMKEKAGVMKPPMTPNTKHVHVHVHVSTVEVKVSAKNDNGNVFTSTVSLCTCTCMYIIQRTCTCTVYMNMHISYW